MRLDYYASATGEGSKGHNPLYLRQPQRETRQCIEYASGVCALSVVLSMMASDDAVRVRAAIPLARQLIVFLFFVVGSVELKEMKNGEC